MARVIYILITEDYRIIKTEQLSASDIDSVNQDMLDVIRIDNALQVCIPACDGDDDWNGTDWKLIETKEVGYVCTSIS